MFDLSCLWNIQRSGLNSRNDHLFTGCHQAIITRPLFKDCTHLSAFRWQCITSWFRVQTSVSTGSKNVSSLIWDLGRYGLSSIFRSELNYCSDYINIAYSHNTNGISFWGGVVCRCGVREDDIRCSEIKNEHFKWSPI